jgi:Uma2 family endonuclease
MAVLKDFQEVLVTGEELYRLPDLGRCELVDGRIVPLSPTGRPHGRAAARLAAHILLFVESHDLGEVLTADAGIYTRRDPDTVRAPDVMFISHGRLAGCKEEGYLDVTPEIVVEVLSPTDRKDQVAKKIEEYFSANVLRVWVLDSKRRQILVHRSKADVQQLGIGDTLTDEELLPGFRLSISELFRS